MFDRSKIGSTFALLLRILWMVAMSRQTRARRLKCTMHSESIGMAYGMKAHEDVDAYI